MKLNSWIGIAAALSIATLLSLTMGCGRQSKLSRVEPTADVPGSADPVLRSEVERDPNQSGDSEEHGHRDGQHGGIIVSLGRDSYHVEAVVATDGQIRLFTLGQDETRVIDVESQTLTGYAKADGDSEAQELSFEPTPQAGDAAGRTSLFLGKLPASLVGKILDVTIPNIRIDGERFRLGFRTVEPAHNGALEMPHKVANDAERELYLTPGGHYVAADIEANGKLTASQKFKGIKSDHNMNPKPGDTLCPISGTKANAKFTWIIGGKPYQFCCPPCIDEFLNNAKTSNEPLPDPESFIKK